MMKRRIVKAAAERKAEIVDCALALFLAKGYEATTIADILARTRLSKGAFYHHFASKEDLLEAAMEHFVGAAIAAVRDVVDDEHLDEVTRLKQLIVRLAEWQHEMNLNAVNVDMLKPQNAALYLRIKTSVDRSIVPVFSRIIERGMRKGEFDALDPDLAAEMLLFLTTARQPAIGTLFEMASDGQIDKAIKLSEEQFVVQSNMMDRVLGLPSGSIDFAATNLSRTQMIGLLNAARKTKTKRKPKAQ